MNIAIVYFSKHGTTEKVAQMIAKNLGENSTTLINIWENPRLNLATFDLIILGCGIYMGTPTKFFRKFCDKNMNVLLMKKVGLFVCGMEADEAKQQQETMNAYPEILLQHAIAKAFLGGEFLFEEMNFMERAIIKRIAKTNKSISALKESEINEFARKLIS